MRGAGETMLGTRIVIAAFRKILVVRSSRRIRVTTLDQRAAGVSLVNRSPVESRLAHSHLNARRKSRATRPYTPRCDSLFESAR